MSNVQPEAVYQAVNVLNAFAKDNEFTQEQRENMAVAMLSLSLQFNHDLEANVLRLMSAQKRISDG